MNILLHSIFSLITTLLSLLKPGGVKALIAENLLLKQQLIVANRGRKRSPVLKNTDRLIFAYLSTLINKKRLVKTAVVLKPATLLNFHKRLVKQKYQKLYSSKAKNKPGPKGLADDVLQLIINCKHHNSHWSPDRIAIQINQTFGLSITDDQVRYALLKHHKPTTNGPSWLTFLGHTKDSLWSLDFFRCESIHLISHWVMVVMDQYTRKVIGYAAHKGDLNTAAACHMLNRIVRQHEGPPPKYLSTDNDPIFKSPRWYSTLGILGIEHPIKSIPYTPVSHPFIERVIGTTRRECLDHMLFWNKKDLEHKLEEFRFYYNETRGHMGINNKTPKQKGGEAHITPGHITDYGWKPYCRGLHQTPVLV